MSKDEFLTQDQESFAVPAHHAPHHHRAALWWASGALLSGGVAALGVLTYALQVEPLDIRLERLTVRLPGAAGRLPKEGLRILQLSDSHFHGEKRTRRRSG